MSSRRAASVAGSSIQPRSSLNSIRLSAAAPARVDGSSSSSPEKLRTRRQRSRADARSGACSRAATTARQAGWVALIRGRSEVSIGMPWSWAIRAKARAWVSGVNPFSA